MRTVTPFILAASAYSLGAPSFPNGFDDLDVRTVRLSPSHVERLPLAVIERLRAAEPISRPLTPTSLAAVRSSLSDALTLTASNISDEAIDHLQGHFQRRLWGPGYVDVTDSEAELVSADSTQAHFGTPVSAPKYPTPDPSAHPELEPMWKMVNSTELKEYVSHLSTAYQSRYYRGTQAREPTKWVQSQFASWLVFHMDLRFGEILSSVLYSQVARAELGTALITIQTTLVENKFDQPNVIGRIEAKSGNSSAPVIILGAHLDSISPTPLLGAPGADDDASGMSVVMTIIRILQASDYKGSYAIEAHAYAAEEAGLLGSDALAKVYKNQGRDVRGMLQFDMVGYQPSTSTNRGKSSTITVLSDPVPSMASHMLKVLEAYVPTAERRNVDCGYGCSDHYSFFDEGFPVVCIAAYGPNDKNLNPNLHSLADTVDKLDFEKMTDFVRAGLAWVVEVAA